MTKGEKNLCALGGHENPYPVGKAAFAGILLLAKATVVVDAGYDDSCFYPDGCFGQI